MDLKVSTRGIPLITQHVLDKPMLTMENYMKWYDVYLIKEDGHVEKADLTSEEWNEGWGDHCISPRVFHNIATRLEASYDDATWDCVCRRYETDFYQKDEDETVFGPFIPGLLYPYL